MMKLKKTSQVSPQTKLKQGGMIVSILLLLACSFFLQKYLNRPRVLTSQAAEYTTSPTSYYGRFAEETVFNFSSVDQIYGFFTTNHYQITQGKALPLGVTLNEGRLTFGGKGGVVIENPLKNESFYRIDFEIEDTGQTNVQGTVNFMEGLWTPVDKSGAYPVVRDNIASVGIDTNVCSYAYSYNDTELMNEYLRLSASSNSAERVKATFSQNNLSRFAKRHNGDIKVSYFVTPIGSYAVVDGVNFSNLPSLYTGDYLLNKGKRINYIAFARFNEGGDPITFKNLKITRLDNGVDTMEEALVYFVKDFYESGKLEAFKKSVLDGAIGSGTGGGGASLNFSNDGGALLFVASVYRFYDYYFGTNHVEEVRSLYNTYISIYEVYAKNEMDSFKASTASNRWDSYNFEFRKTHYHPLLTYALSGYLTQEQLLRARNIYSQVVDLVMEKIISLDKDTPFSYNNQYIGDTKAEEFWNLNYLVGYLVLFPEDKIRSQYLKDYINFESFVMLSDGRSMKDYYGSAFSFNFLSEDYLNYRMKNIHSDGNLDQHGFHPSLNYASACASIPNLKNLLGKNGLELKALSDNPFASLVYNESILKHYNQETLRHKQPISKIRPVTGGFQLYNEEDHYLYENGRLKGFQGTTLPSLLEDWATTFDTLFSVFESFGDESLANESARNVYYLRYPNKGDLTCANYNCTFSDYNYNSINGLWTSLFSRKININYTENKPLLPEVSPLSVTLYGPATATVGEAIDYSVAVNDPSSQLKTVGIYYAKKAIVDSQGTSASWSTLTTCSLNNAANSTCRGSLSFPESTDYYIHAVAITNGSPLRSCSGNPVCNHYPCNGFYDCGANDSLVVSVVSPPVSTPSGLTISDLNVSNGKSYQVDKVSQGGLLYIDRNYTITNFPAGFNNGLIIKTAADDKFETATSFLRFRVNRAADIYVAYDRRASVLPNWLSSQFTKVSGMTVGASEPNLSYFNLYKKTLNEAGEVILGGNYASPANGAQISYVVFVVEKEAVNTPTPTPTPATLEVYNLNPSRYRVVSLATGIKYFVDRSDKIKSYPSSLRGGLLIMTANDDKSQTSADFLSFTINKSANIYVAYDRRASSLPFWLSSFVSTGERIEVSGDSMGYFKLYRKAYPAGKVVLGGNLASGAKGARTNYIVIIKEAK